MRYSDKDLQDYLSGTLDKEVAEALEHALSKDSALEKRLLALDPLSETVPEAFDNCPPADRLQSLRQRMATDPAWTARVPVWKRPLAFAAGAGVAGAIVASVLFLAVGTGPQPMADWHQQVAAYQALYVPDTVLNIEPTSEALQQQFRDAEAAIGLDLQPDVLADLQPLTLKRAQILGYQGAPLIQIAFSTPDGTPVAFCILRYDEPSGGAKTAYAEMEGLASATWATNTHGFMLIGGEDEAEIKRIAERLVATFGTRAQDS